MKCYRKGKWEEFRRGIIEIDDGICSVCGRGEPAVVLQVHHKRYIQGKLPWEYAYDDCETLCKGCHAAEHGIIPPKFGWEYAGYDDLGDLIGECELCGSGLRHQFFVHHDKWGTMQVGTYCCDSLTETETASNCKDSKKRCDDRKNRFIKSKRWKNEGEAQLIKQNSIQVKIVHDNGNYRIKMDNKLGKLVFSSLNEAKSKVFEVIENGEANKYLSGNGKKP